MRSARRKAFPVVKDMRPEVPRRDQIEGVAECVERRRHSHRPGQLVNDLPKDQQATDQDAHIACATKGWPQI